MGELELFLFFSNHNINKLRKVILFGVLDVLVILSSLILYVFRRGPSLQRLHPPRSRSGGIPPHLVPILASDCINFHQSFTHLMYHPQHIQELEHDNNDGRKTGI